MTAYLAALRAQLELPDLGSVGDDAVRAVLSPSFDRDVAITAWTTEQTGPRIEVRVLPPAGRLRAMAAAGYRSQIVVRKGPHVGGGPVEVPPSAPDADADPRPRVSEQPLAGELWRTLWSRVASSDRALLRVERPLGLDGMSVAIAIRTGGATEDFDLWSPSRWSTGGALVLSLVELACVATRAVDPELCAAAEKPARYVR